MDAWSWVLTAFGLATMWLAGRKVWWAWYVGLSGQLVWLAYAVTTGQLGFLFGTVAYSAVYLKNARAWTSQRWPACQHPDVVCIHGDEIIASNWDRSRCISCGRTFPDLPDVCFYTGEPHSSGLR